MVFSFFLKWQSSIDDTGRKYYYNVNGGNSCWELPLFDDITLLKVPGNVSKTFLMIKQDFVNANFFVIYCIYIYYTLNQSIEIKFI